MECLHLILLPLVGLWHHPEQLEVQRIRIRIPKHLQEKEETESNPKAIRKQKAESRKQKAESREAGKQKAEKQKEEERGKKKKKRKGF